MVSQPQKNKLEELEWKTTDQLERILRRKHELIAETTLSKREIDVYLVYRNHPEAYNLKETAKLLGLKPNTVYTYHRKIKEKARKARKTARLMPIE